MEQGKIMGAEVPTVRVGATPTGLTAPPPPQPRRFFTGRMPFLPPNQQRQKALKVLTYTKNRSDLLWSIHHSECANVPVAQPKQKFGNDWNGVGVEQSRKLSVRNGDV